MANPKHMYSYLEEDDPSFNLNPFLVDFIRTCPFFAELSRRIKKVATKAIPTMGVSYDARTDDIALFWNPDFAASLTPVELVGVLKHEFYHLVFNHVTTRRREPHPVWNIATDLAINSIILSTKSNTQDLPSCALVPGEWPKNKDSEIMTEEQKAAAPLAALIASFPKLNASEWYFSALMEFAKDNMKAFGNKCSNCGGDMSQGSSNPGDKQNDESASKGKEGESSDGEGDFKNPGKMKCPHCGQEHDVGHGGGGADSFDNHDMWDNISDDDRERIENKIRSMVEAAVKHAQSSSNGWGDVPQEIREEIMRSVSNIIPWRSVLKQFIGSLLPGERTTSIKRINRKYPYIHPGVKRSRIAKILVAMDQSGSVGNDSVELFFAELASLTKKIEIDIVSFDNEANKKDIVRWRRGTPLPSFRTRCGGTSFDAPTDLANDPSSRRRWDGILIMTDGEAPAPKDCHIKRGWILAPGCKLHFDSKELQVFIDKNKPLQGAFR